MKGLQVRGIKKYSNNFLPVSSNECNRGSVKAITSSEKLYGFMEDMDGVERLLEGQSRLTERKIEV